MNPDFCCHPDPCNLNIETHPRRCLVETQPLESREPKSLFPRFHNKLDRRRYVLVLDLNDRTDNLLALSPELGTLRVLETATAPRQHLVLFLLVRHGATHDHATETADK